MANSVEPDQMLILILCNTWVYTVSSGLCVQILRVNMVIYDFVHIHEYKFSHFLQYSYKKTYEINKFASIKFCVYACMLIMKIANINTW